MFTGIITDVGEVLEIRAPAPDEARDHRLRLGCAYALEEVPLGASIACDGVCLTVVAKDPAARWFEIDASAETIERTTLGDWTAGRRVNLERPLKIGDELGGHIVTGHVDAVAAVADLTAEGESTRVTLAAPRALAPYIASKGSVALDGCSLTLNEVADTEEDVRFGVNLIPHTKRWTRFESLTVGERLNVEIDVLARYVARMNDVARAGDGGGA